MNFNTSKTTNSDRYQLTDNDKIIIESLIDEPELVLPDLVNEFQAWYSYKRERTNSGKNFTPELIELLRENSRQQNWPLAFRTKEMFARNVSKLKKMKCKST